MKKKNITIDTLAKMIAKGFGGVDLRFNKVDKRFDRVEDRLERIEKLLIVDHRRRIEKLEITVSKGIKRVVSCKIARGLLSRFLFYGIIKQYALYYPR